MPAEIVAQDRPFAATELVDANGVAFPANLGGSATWTSRWFTRNMHMPRVLVSFYGDQPLAANGLVIEESFSPEPLATMVVHNQYTASTVAKTLGGAARYAASSDNRVIAPHFRIVVINAATAQTVARLDAISAAP